jgi:hypothetical protein
VYRGEDFTLHSATPVDDGAWHFVVAERNASTSELFLYIDGVQQGCPASRKDPTTPSPSLAPGALVGKCYGLANNTAPLDDGHDRIAVGWMFDGCLRDLELRGGGGGSGGGGGGGGGHGYEAGSAFMGPAVVQQRMLKRAVPGQGLPKIPLYYYYFNNEESKVLHDSFLQSLKDSGNLEGLDVRGMEASNGTTNGARWSFKTDMILSQLKANRGEVIMFADIDILWMRPIAPLLWRYLRDQDVVFQRNDDFSLEANIGFMAMRCNDQVIGLWEKVHEITMTEKMSRTPPYKRPAIQGGDQRIANKLLFNPGLMDTPKDLRWSTLPSDVMTQVGD